MPNEPDEQHPIETLEGSDFTTFATEYRSDDRTLRRAVGIAVGFHLLLLALHLPEITEPVHAEEPKRNVFVVQSPKFKEPVVQEERQVPERKPRLVAVPDPDPNDPEVVRELVAEVPEIDLADVDLAVGIPDEPPPIITDAPIVVSGEVVPPERVHAPEPTYTEIARRARAEGVVIVQAIIDRDGRVTNVKLLKGLGYGLDENTINAVKGWRFTPATLGGHTVSVYYTLTVHFGVS